MDSGMVEVDTVTFGGASASGTFRGPKVPTGGCWRPLHTVGGAPTVWGRV